MTALAACAVAFVISSEPAWAADGDWCALEVGGVLGGQTDGVLVSGECRAASDTPEDAPSLNVRHVECGSAPPPGVPAQPIGDGTTCGACTNVTSDNLYMGPAVTTFIQGADGTWINSGSWCPGALTPNSPGLRERAVALLPKIEIGLAPEIKTLVNLETLMWAQTSAERDLGTVRVVGQNVRIRAKFHEAQWDFGDGTTETSAEPGRPFGPEDHCSTKLCDDWYGHVYTATGQRTITLRVNWTAEFSVNGTTWQAIPGAPITGPAATAGVSVLEARGVLVDSPSR